MQRRDAERTDVFVTQPSRGGSQPYVLVLNDQGGAQMSISVDQTATLRAEDHGHAPVIVCGVDLYNQCVTGGCQRL